MARALGIQAKHGAMGEGEEGLIAGSGELPPERDVLRLELLTRLEL